MDYVQPILIKQTYGKIVFHFKDIMDFKNITRSRLAKLADMRFEVADRLYNGRIERLDMDILCRVCFVLKCNVADLIEYKYEAD